MRTHSFSLEKLDPQKQLKEAGYPFNHIATELTELHGKFEVVSADVRVLKDQFEKQTRELSGKIESETGTLARKIEETKSALLDKFAEMFTQRFSRVVGTIIGAISILYGLLCFLQKSALNKDGISLVAVVLGVLIFATTWIITRK